MSYYESNSGSVQDGNDDETATLRSQAEAFAHLAVPPMTAPAMTTTTTSRTTTTTISTAYQEQEQEQDLEAGRRTVNVPVPMGAAELVGLFNPPSSTDDNVKSTINNNTFNNNSTADTHASNGNMNGNSQKQQLLQHYHQRTETPPCLPPFDATECPPTPSGLTWRKAGSTFNLYPHTLITTGRKNSSGAGGVRLEQLDQLPRLVKRNRAFAQSANKVYVRHNQGTKIYRLLRFNWFHVLLRWPTKWSLLLLLSVWTLTILLFAALYVLYDKSNATQKCGLGGSGEDDSPLHFAGAFAFSLETCTTVGYGLPSGINSFFEKGCSGLQIIIYLQMAWSLIFNAFLITFVYNRLGRSETRSIQVIFSDKALVSIVDNQVRFQVRLFDCDTKHPVVEAHVRMYCVMKHRPVPRPLRILQPDDDLGAMLFLSFPNVVSHNIDMYSLLHPPVSSILMKPKGLVLRQVDGYTANRDDIICPICGESYGNFERWCNHVRYQQIVERQDSYPVANTHLSLDMKEIEKEPYSKPIQDIESLKQYFKHNVSEILCLVEGIDPINSGTFQALQSYRFEDIQWESYAQFSPCLTVVKVPRRRNEQLFMVDLDRYHDIVPDPEADAAAKRREEEDDYYLPKLPTTPSGRLRKTNDEIKPKGAAAAAATRKRHKRIKSLSSGISDSLFTT